MKQHYNIDREFIRWFYEENYPDVKSNRAMVMAEAPLNVSARDYWMRLAFKAGARSMAGESLCILGDWASAVSGLDPDLMTPDEVFDRAQENLCYYYEQLELQL